MKLFSQVCKMSVGAILATVFGGCSLDTVEAGAQSSGGESTEALIANNGSLVPTKSVTYCFREPPAGYDPNRWTNLKNDFSNAISTTWGNVFFSNGSRVLDISLVPCSGSETIRVDFRKDTYSGGEYTTAGRLIEMDREYVTGPAGNGYGYDSTARQNYSQSYFRYGAIHEFGHALGFAHEQNNTGSTCNIAADIVNGSGTSLTGYDPSSVMNYCNYSQAPALSALDMAGFRAAYAPLTPSALHLENAGSGSDGRTIWIWGNGYGFNAGTKLRYGGSCGDSSNWYESTVDVTKPDLGVDWVGNPGVGGIVQHLEAGGSISVRAVNGTFVSNCFTVRRNW